MQKTLIALFLLISVCLSPPAEAQEINAVVNINKQKVQGENESLFETLKESLTQFINERQWTDLQFKRNERINCNFNITVNKYDASSNLFNCTLLLQSNRPVWGSSYNTIAYSIKDENFNFEFQEFDQLEFRPDVIDKDLTALIAYYVYLIIGIDLDTFSERGGDDQFNMAMRITNNAQGLTASQKGWKAFEDNQNRYAIITDLLDGGMENFRSMLYVYHRQGLDVMAENPDRGRAAITQAIEMLDIAHKDKPLSMLPQLFTEYKYEELVNIYRGKGSAVEKEKIVEILSNINASLNASWREMQH